MNATQQTDAGVYLTRDTNGVLTYGIFTIQGVSGGPVEAICPGLAYGIHTRGGCPPGNTGVAVDMPDLQDALVANWIDGGFYEPQGVCGAAQDCNDNGIEDYCDVTCTAPGCTQPCGGSEDCTGNYIPDECEADCNNNGVADSCDVLYGTSPDVNDNGMPDECEPDCNDNGNPDLCDIVDEMSEDCDENWVPDECQERGMAFAALVW